MYKIYHSGFLWLILKKTTQINSTGQGTLLCRSAALFWFDFCFRVARGRNLRDWGGGRKKEPAVVFVRLEINSLCRLTNLSNHQSGMNQSETTGNNLLGQCSFNRVIEDMLEENHTASNRLKNLQVFIEGNERLSGIFCQPFQTAYQRGI